MISLLSVFRPIKGLGATGSSTSRLRGTIVAGSCF
jgi:hypothetical protein